MTTPTVRDLCLYLAIDFRYLLACIRDGSFDPATLQECADRANTARDLLKAEPVGEGPSERIVSIAKAVQKCAFAHESNARLVGNVCAEDVADLCDAVLARWGHPAVPLAPEAGELAKWLEEEAEAYRQTCGNNLASANLARAAALLQQQEAELVALRSTAPPAPAEGEVGVAERPWERDGWCDEQGYCWFFSPRFNTWSWERPPVALTRGVGRFLSLPHYAIPLPQGGEAI